MLSRVLVSALSLLLVMAPCVESEAQDHKRRRAPPSEDGKGKGKGKGHGKRRGKGHDKGHGKGHGKHRGKGHDKARRRAPAAPDAKWGVRKPPKLKGFAPASGPVGTVVTIRGKHLGQGAAVRFNGRKLRVLSSAPKQLTVRIPRRAVTDNLVVVKAGFPASVSRTQFIVVRPPVIRGFSPPRGDVGAVVTVRGKHFIPADRVFVGQRQMKVITSRPHLLQARVPKGALTGPIAIQRAGHVLARSRRSFVVSLPQPVISGFSPAQGAAGTVVRVTGRHFDRRDVLMLGRRKLVLRRYTPTMLEAVVGKHSTGQLILRGPSGRRAVSARPFVVIRPPKAVGFRPVAGPPGTRIQVAGMHFQPRDTVFIGNRALTVRTITPTRIIAELPNGVTTGRVSVRRGAQVSMARGIFRVEYAPTIASISPKAGPPGTTVRILGNHFGRRSKVLIAGVKIPVVKRRGPTEIWARITPVSRTGPIVVLSRRRGSARSATNFVVERYAALTGFLPPRGLPGSTLRVQGRNFDARTRVYLGNMALAATRVTPHQIWVKIPAGARSGRVSIQTHGRRLTARGNFVVLQPPPQLSFVVSPPAARRGSEVTLTLTPPQRFVAVYFNGRPLPKRIFNRGRRIVVTIPADARSGIFEVEFKGRRYRAPRTFRVLP